MSSFRVSSPLSIRETSTTGANQRLDRTRTREVRDERFTEISRYRRRATGDHIVYGARR